ncbi:MAG TPA: type II toxin-antitoxin system HipA family toxin [Bacteroidetes bacterium]|nr:type II toxin-antitoxin system HipA family toxin [Bacteroidota bacterium]
MGVLHAERLRGKEIFSFEYDKDWLSSEPAQILDPDLQYYSGIQYLNDDEKTNFGVFLDSSPDCWGRVLMLRREAAAAKKEARPQQSFFETDYLLGVYDGHRMGALRYKMELNGPFLNDNEDLASPPWTSIRELEEVSLRLENDDVVDHPEYIKWLNMLVAPGSSLGGARPKASVLDQHNHLWIAKFPSKLDGSDMGAWEMVTHKLAIAAGLNMAEAQARRFSSKHHTFLTKRFDRTQGGKRVHFASAMTLLGFTDGQDHVAGVSYLDLVEFITSRGANVKDDLEQLWRRIVFSICVANTDDHLRNHGFILTNSGWVLSPAYDINPVETGAGLKLNISDTDNALDLNLALEVHSFFRIKAENAVKIIEEVKSAVRAWRTVATGFEISRAEQALKSRAFQQAEY